MSNFELYRLEPKTKTMASIGELLSIAGLFLWIIAFVFYFVLRLA